MKMKPIIINETYDVICPYCYLGMEAFEQASINTGIPVEFEHQPFLLHNGVPYDGVRIGDYLGGLSQEQRASMYTGQQSAAAELGVEIKDGDDLIVRNSISAHIAIEYASRFGKADEALRAFFKAHFTDQTPIDRIPEIIEVLSTVIPDLDKETLKKEIENPENIARVQIAAEQARQAGVQSVPTYVVNGTPIGGSLTTDAAEEVLRQFAQAAA